MDNSFTLQKVKFIGNLADPKIFEQISFLSRGILDSGSQGLIYNLAQDLDHLLQSNKELIDESRSNYKNILVQLRLKSLLLASDQEIEDILKHHLAEANKNETDLKRLFYLMFAPEFTREDYSRLSLFLGFIENNNEIVGNKNIGGEQSLVPTIGNWLKSYKSQTPEDKGSLNIVNYLTKSPDVKQLTQEEIELFKYSVYFYDWLRFKASKISASALGQSDQQRKDSVQPSSSINKSTIITESNQTKTLTEFEKKLASVSVLAPSTGAPSGHGVDLEALKQRMASQTQSMQPKAGQTSPIPPQQTPVKTQQVRIPSPPAPLPQTGEGGSNLKKIDLTPEEIKRETTTPELPASPDASQGGVGSVAVPVAPVLPMKKYPMPQPVAPTVPRPIPPAAPVIRPPQPISRAESVVNPQVRDSSTRAMSNPERLARNDNAGGLAALSRVKGLDDLKTIDIGILRQGPIRQQISNLKSTILNLARANNLLPYYAVNAFEQSPLFRAYLAHGNSKVSGEQVRGDLTQEEFEAVADLKKEIERL